ncbi:MAG: hypothetical protein ACTS44_00685 [Candidatus Hodgkinia cicadicola]
MSLEFNKSDNIKLLKQINLLRKINPSHSNCKTKDLINCDRFARKRNSFSNETSEGFNKLTEVTETK